MTDGAAVQASTDDRVRVVDTVVRAFAADPAFRHFFPDDATYGEQAAAFAGWLFDRRVGHGTVWVADTGAAVAMWEPPHPAGSADRAEPELVVPDAVRERLDGYERTVHRVLPAQPYWYLGVLATAPEHAGRGLARAVMRAGLDRAGADGVPAVLETTNPGNLGLYEHLGWQVHASTIVGVDDGLGAHTLQLTWMTAATRVCALLADGDHSPQVRDTGEVLEIPGVQGQAHGDGLLPRSSRS